DAIQSLLAKVRADISSLSALAADSGGEHLVKTLVVVDELNSAVEAYDALCARKRTNADGDAKAKRLRTVDLMQSEQKRRAGLLADRLAKVIEHEVFGFLDAGELATIYCVSRSAARQIVEFLPKAKVVYCNLQEGKRSGSFDRLGC